MDIAALTLELTDDPEGLGYTGHTAQEVADLLNAPRVTGTTLRRISAVEFVDTIPEAAFRALLVNMKSNTAAVAGPAQRLEAYLRYANDAGLDISAGSKFREAALAAGLTTDMGLALLALATVDVVQSRAEQLGLGIVGDGHVRSCVGTEWEVTD